MCVALCRSRNNLNKMLRQAESHLHLSIDKCPQIPRVVSVPDVQVMRWNIQLLVSEAEKLQLRQPDLQSIPPVWQDLHGNIPCRGDLWGLPSLQWQHKTFPSASVRFLSVSHWAVLLSFILNCETGFLTHQLFAVICFDTLRDVVAGSTFQFLQGFQQFLLLPEQKDDILSSAALFTLSDLHICREGGLITGIATLINKSSRFQSVSIKHYYICSELQQVPSVFLSHRSQSVQYIQCLCV